jgi:hypothetical protein
MNKEVRLHHYLLLALIIAGAALLRYQYNTTTWIDTPIRGDATYYVAYANNLIEHQVFSRSRASENPVPDAYWAPGYPVFLAGNIVLADLLQVDSYTLTLLSQAVLGTLTVALVFMLAALAMPAGWALFAATLMALSPHSVSLGSYLLTETLFCFLLTLSLLLLTRALSRPGTLLAACAGITFAATYMVNPISLFVAPAALAMATLLSRRKSSLAENQYSLRVTLWILAPLFLTVIAWSLRSSLAVPDTGASSGSRLLGNLIIGMYSEFHEVWRADPRDPQNPATLAAARIGGSYLAFFQELTAKFLADPGAMFNWYLLGKPMLLWDWNILVGQGDIFVFPVHYSLYHISRPALATHAVMSAAHGWLLLLGLAAFVCAWRDRGASRVPMAVLLTAATYCSLVYVITQAEPRYSVPFRPLLYIAAAYTLSRIAAWLLEHRRQHQLQLRQASGPHA